MSNCSSSTYNTYWNNGTVSRSNFTFFPKFHKLVLSMNSLQIDEQRYKTQLNP